jgi:hypothetical protein
MVDSPSPYPVFQPTLRPTGRRAAAAEAYASFARQRRHVACFPDHAFRLDTLAGA